MVNNPHLSDLQFQVDSGEVVYAHMFVLYARCPQLMEFVSKRVRCVCVPLCVGFAKLERAKNRHRKLAPFPFSQVDHKGFLVAEGDGVRTRRVLLDDVSGEAVHVFLSHLYAGDHTVPPHVLPDVVALAIRFV